ncbi:MAG: competence/damage-inducible protein A [Geobacter sp.]|nr:competence/damage-inducible protein A [Geobacter sp.]
MKIATLSIGDELLFGETVDTNAGHIAAGCFESGMRVVRHLAVGDDEGEITDALQWLASRYDAVIATGGLGPTGDDLTARAAARAFGVRLALNEAALGHLREFFLKRNLPMSPACEKQALLPARAGVIPNPVGTACGFNFMYEGCRFHFLPGVPREMERMLAETVIPAMQKELAGGPALRTRILKVFGHPEVELERMLGDLRLICPDLQLAFCVEFPEVHVKLRISGEPLEADRRLAELAARVRERLGDSLFAEGGETIDTVVARLLREKKATLALAESCTGGLLAKRITDVSGSSAYFLQGMVTYSNEAKTRLLQVPAGLIAGRGAVSAEVARAMAEGVRKSARSKIGLAITGIAGPEGGSDDKPVGTVFIALAASSGTIAREYRFHGDRERIRSIASFAAMDWLRKHLLST